MSHCIYIIHLVNREKTSKKKTLKLLKESSERRRYVNSGTPYKTPNRGFDPFSGIRRGDRAPRAKHFSPRGELAFPRATRGFIFSRIEAVRRYSDGFSKCRTQNAKT